MFKKIQYVLFIIFLFILLIHGIFRRIGTIKYTKNIRNLVSSLRVEDIKEIKLFPIENDKKNLVQKELEINISDYNTIVKELKKIKKYEDGNGKFVNVKWRTRMNIKLDKKDIRLYFDQNHCNTLLFIPRGEKTSISGYHDIYMNPNFKKILEKFKK